jgi:hypothetical protein
MGVAKGNRLAVKTERQVIAGEASAQHVESFAAATIATLPAKDN